MERWEKGLDRWLTMSDEEANRELPSSGIFVYQVVDGYGDHVDVEENPFNTEEEAKTFIKTIENIFKEMGDGTSEKLKICKVEI